MASKLLNIYVKKDRIAFNSRVKLSKVIKSSPTALTLLNDVQCVIELQLTYLDDKLNS